MAGRPRRGIALRLARGQRYRSLGRLVRYQAVAKGLYGDSRGWRTVWFALTAGGFLRRTFGRHPEVAAVEVLRPGEQITLRTITPPTRSERRAAKKR